MAVFDTEKLAETVPSLLMEHAVASINPVGAPPVYT